MRRRGGAEDAECEVKCRMKDLVQMEPEECYLQELFLEDRNSPLEVCPKLDHDHNPPGHRYNFMPL